MMGPYLLLQATLLVVVGGFSIIQHPYYLHQPLLSDYKQINIRSSDTSLPCPAEGFYVHPQNCSRFYRCVDYAGTGYLFSRYLFECPQNHIFLTAVQTCLPGNCNGLVQPVVQPPKQPSDVPVPVPVTVDPSQTETSTEGTLPVVQTVEPSPVEPETETIFPGLPEVTGAPPVEVHTDNITPTEVATVSPVTVTAPTEAPAGEICLDTYVQHPVYCNVYNPCNEPFVRYVCPTGTVFDQSRQMCRISAADDGLCTDKEIFQHSFLLRSENIGAHVLLPESIILPTTRPLQNYPRPTGDRPAQTYRRPTASPLQLYLWPTVRTVQTYGEHAIPDSTASKPLFTDYSLTKFRPLLNRPAQTRPADSSPRYSSASNAAQSFQNVAVPLPPTRLKPLANVRRPVGHLHFPYYNPENPFPFRQEVIIV